MRTEKIYKEVVSETLTASISAPYSQVSLLERGKNFTLRQRGLSRSANLFPVGGKVLKINLLTFSGELDCLDTVNFITRMAQRFGTHKNAPHFRLKF